MARGGFKGIWHQNLTNILLPYCLFCLYKQIHGGRPPWFRRPNQLKFLGLAPTGRLRRVGSRAGVVSFGQRSWCHLGPCWAISLHRAVSGGYEGAILGPYSAIVEAMLDYVGRVGFPNCLLLCLCKFLAQDLGASLGHVGNFMELCWRYLGSNVAGSVGPSWVMWGVQPCWFMSGKCFPQPCWTHHEVHLNRFGVMLKNCL